ncbi:MAG: hypothetical protein ABEK50_11790, partial [bacterium]
QQWRALPDSDTTERNFEVFDPLDLRVRFSVFVFAPCSMPHAPSAIHMIRYYGWYSNKSRGMRAKQTRTDEDVPEHLLPEPNTKQIRWATLIKNVYEVDSLKCPVCGAEMCGFDVFAFCC